MKVKFIDMENKQLGLFNGYRISAGNMKNVLVRNRDEYGCAAKGICLKPLKQI